MRILVVVPVFNEERYVTPVLREIRKYVRAAAIAESVEIRMLVVDDGSTDATPAVLQDLVQRGHIELITHPENRGYGQSLIDAFSFAAGSRTSRHGHYDWVITLDCDEQHEPCRIPLFVRECLKNDADLISGSRYLEENSEGQPPPDRRNINRLITELLNSALHFNVTAPATGVGSGQRTWKFIAPSATSLDDPQHVITDSFCGFKAYRVAALQRMALTIPGYAFPMQFWVQAAALGFRIRELPVKLIYKDATRHFGGMLDDPAARLQHYLEVLTQEMRAARQNAAPASECSSCCQ